MQTDRCGKRRMEESVEASKATWAHTEQTLKGSEGLPESYLTLKSTNRVLMYKNPLFGMQIPYMKDAPFLSFDTVALLNNFSYNLKVAWSITLVPYRQYLMKSTVGRNLFESITLAFQVR